MYIMGCIVGSIIMLIFLKQFVNILKESSISPQDCEIILTFLFMLTLSWLGVYFMITDIYKYYKEK
jgi:hypothetical protein